MYHWGRVGSITLYLKWKWEVSRRHTEHQGTTSVITSNSQVEMQLRASTVALHPPTNRRVAGRVRRQIHTPKSNFLSCLPFCTLVAPSVKWGLTRRVVTSLLWRPYRKHTPGWICGSRSWPAELEQGPRGHSLIKFWPSRRLSWAGHFSLSDLSDFPCGMRWWCSVIFSLKSLWPKPYPPRVWLSGGWGIPHKECCIWRSGRVISPSLSPFLHWQPCRTSEGEVRHLHCAGCWVLDLNSEHQQLRQRWAVNFLGSKSPSFFFSSPMWFFIT